MYLENIALNMKLKNLFLFLSIAVLACQAPKQVQSLQATHYSVSKDSIAADPAVTAMIAPYKTRLDSLMNVDIIYAEGEFRKDQPEGSLGNMVCDVLMRYAKKQGYSPDLCLMNNGGLRIPVIYKGSVSVRTIYELMPFENQLLLLKIKGSKMQELLETIAATGGAPVAGIKMEIDNRSISSLTIQGKPFDVSKEYWVLTSDYLANGGDKADALKDPLEVKDFNKLIRDVLIETLAAMDTEGAHLVPITDGRISKK
jgi:2',3'-cyclic-nucleotide 2'-phosphodiesterase (5'-nucleotidase family)